MKKHLVAFSLVSLMAMSMPFAASAHRSPGGCTATGVGLSITVYRADGTTPIGGGSAVPGETIKYEATLSHLGGSNCDYGAGMLALTAPNGAVTDVTPGGGIPDITVGNPFVSAQVSYVVSGADVGGDGDLDAVANYTNGSSHTAGGHTTVGAAANTASDFDQLDPTVTTQIHNPGHTNVTAGAVSQGTNIHDQATVSGSGPTPSGTVDFTRYSDNSCTAVASTENDVALSGGVAESSVFATTPGFHSYRVHYDGDLNYTSSTDPVCEVVEAVEAGTIVIEKQTLPDGSGQTFDFVRSYATGTVSLSDGQTSNSGPLDAGIYSVSENALAGWDQTSAVCTDGSDPSAIDLAAGETVTCVFTNTERGTISGNKWHDADGDGTNNGENPMANVTIFADLDDNGVLDGGEPSDITDGSGNYTLGPLVPGSYEVCEVVGGMQQMYPDPLVNGGCHTVSIGAGEDATGYNFGNLQNEHEGTIGFWKNWNRHNKFTQAEINGWLNQIDNTAWFSGHAYTPLDTTDMRNIIIDATKLCDNKTNKTECAKRKFLAQYMVTQLNVLSGKKSLATSYTISGPAASLLGVSSPALLGTLFTATDTLAPSLNRNEYLTLMSMYDTINNMGI